MDEVAITIPGDTAGTWVVSGNAGGLAVVFGMGVGSTFSGPANAWAATNYMVPTGSASVVGTNGAQFLVTGVKLEIGSVATPYNRQSLTKSMADCQRYYQTAYVSSRCYANAASMVFGNTIGYAVAMRALPTITAVSPTYENTSTISFRQLARFYFYRQLGNVGGSGSYGIYVRRDPCSGALTMTYTLTAHPNTIVRDSDQAFIPTDPDNVDYQIYLQFLEDGGVPTPYTPPPVAKEK